ncbi:hypothetical protein [Sphingomonas sp. 3-13AW]|uniref:hypothetical protein n=1 Tax=Sphingomonas sp. 3-13AW TaxID=3050450 RepID=UPI003BB7B55E
MEIKAETYSDDRAVEVNFDALRWFEQASDEEILELARCEWGGDYPADAVAQHFEGAHGEVTEMFEHIAHMQNTRNPIGFECHVNEDDAMAWLLQNKPDLHKKILADQVTETESDPECSVGLHSWVNEVGRLPADTSCTRCGELYGDPA